MELNYGLCAFIFACFFVIHGIADYWVQTDWQAQNKSKNWIALWTHVYTYSLCFIPVGIYLYHMRLICGCSAYALPFVIGLPHAFMDHRGFLYWFLKKTKGWDSTPGESQKLMMPQVAVRIHVGIEMDQKYHYACLLLTAIWLAIK